MTANGWSGMPPAWPLANDDFALLQTLWASYASANGWPADLIVEPDPEQLAAPQLLVIKSSASMRFVRIYMGSWLVRKAARQSRILRSHSLLGMEGSFGSGVCCRQAE